VICANELISLAQTEGAPMKLAPAAKALAQRARRWLWPIGASIAQCRTFNPSRGDLGMVWRNPGAA
jgi:hypothetical protein